MQRHLSTAFFASYVLYAALLVCSSQWNAASGSVVVDHAAASSASSVAEHLRSRSVRSVVAASASDILESPSADSLSRPDDEDVPPQTKPNPYNDESDNDDVVDDDVNVEEGEEFEKRKWGDNKARVWGKRKWGDNRARVWGKRGRAGLTSSGHRSLSAAEFLRKVEEENRKLAEEGESEKSGKRKWGDNKARVWGK